MNNTNEKTWHAVDVAVANDAVEAVEFALCQLDALGTAINQFHKTRVETVTVTGYFNEPPDDKVLRDALQKALLIYDFDNDAIRGVTCNEIENADWLAEWKKHWRPTNVGRFVIAPPWSDIADTENIVVRIEPNMAFGTGTHETTQLCLKAIDENYEPVMSLLDVGTGTGILAIAVAKLASEKSEFVGFDTDVDSVKIARENAAANGVDNVIDFFVGSITDQTPTYDFVCANLTLDVITPLLPLLIEKSRRLLLLSGILVEQEDAIDANLRKLQITNFEIERSGEWISILIRKS